MPAKRRRQKANSAKSRGKNRSKGRTGPHLAQEFIGHPTLPFTALAAAPTVGVTVTRTTQGGAIASAKLNGMYLQFHGDVAHAVVGANQSNTIEWIAVGPAGSSYSITVNEPPGTGCQGGATLDEDGRDEGSCDFNT